jgi:hypothetical protein
MSVDAGSRVRGLSPEHTELLRAVPLMRNLRDADLGRLLAVATLRRLKVGQALEVVGQLAPGLVLVCSGSLALDGVAMAEPWLGERDVLEPGVWQQNVTALQPTECLVLSSRALHAVVHGDPEVGVALLRAVGRGALTDDGDDPQLLRYAVDLRESFREGERAQGALQRSVMGAVRALVEVAEAKDPRTVGHAARAARTARAVADELHLGAEVATHATLGGLLHDIGFLAVDGERLRRAAGTGEEMDEQIRQHPELGARIIGHVESLAPVVPYILDHHEQADGRGYPRGLRGAVIPLAGRLMAAVEVFETARQLHGFAHAVAEVRRQVGSRLDPDTAMALTRVAQRGELDA